MRICWQPWKAKHLNVEIDTGTTRTTVAEVEIDNEHGVQKYSWPVSWVEVGEIKDFLPEAGTAYKYGESQVWTARISTIVIPQCDFADG